MQQKLLFWICLLPFAMYLSGFDLFRMSHFFRNFHDGCLEHFELSIVCML